jgi:hypothetical protein
MTQTLETWIVEPGDPSVGIFGDSVFHQTHDVEDSAVLVESNMVRVENGLAIGEDVWECECGDRVTFEWSQPAD